MFALNERLSEYAYGFGATTEALALLRSVGVHAVPFLPNLIHEAEVGFDVSFSAPGTLLMLQFKLGHQLDRFVRKPANQTSPDVVRPFWRFEVNVDHHQFIRLRSWETLGADVYYVAPRFADWQAYERHFLRGAILEHSLLMTPADIHTGAGGAPGKHRIVYDRTSRFVCSERRRTPRWPRRWPPCGLTARPCSDSPGTRTRERGLPVSCPERSSGWAANRSPTPERRPRLRRTKSRPQPESLSSGRSLRRS